LVAGNRDDAAPNVLDRPDREHHEQCREGARPHPSTSRFDAATTAGTMVVEGPDRLIDDVCGRGRPTTSVTATMWQRSICCRCIRVVLPASVNAPGIR